MDTVKIDAQKLQLLNDRISQTIDALNQVRLSTHGLQHSGPQTVPQWGQQPLGVAAFYGQTIPGQALPVQVLPTGIEHSAPAFGPAMGQAAFAPTAGQVGFGAPVQQGFAQPLSAPQIAYGTQGLGISHSQPVVGQFRPQMVQPYQQYAATPMISY
jgi:hypothetical protein